MGSVTEPKLKSSGRSIPCAQIRKKRGGKVVFSLSETFEREAAARRRMEEKELDKPGVLERAIAAAKATARPTLDGAIDRQVRESAREPKETKAQVLRSIREDEIASMACEDIRSDHLVAFAKPPSTEGWSPRP